mmetsp:Transcript_6520/g.23662  ORF Transcript_6520/g.23662 Transcript_6520/m.23662 type:complete len:100 (+) Transcript_6520:813-1112(+)
MRARRRLPRAPSSAARGSLPSRHSWTAGGGERPIVTPRVGHSDVTPVSERTDVGRPRATADDDGRASHARSNARTARRVDFYSTQPSTWMRLRTPSDAR